MANIETQSSSNSFFCSGGDGPENCGAFQMHAWKKALMVNIVAGGGEITDVIFTCGGHRPEGCRLGRQPNPTCPAIHDDSLNGVTVVFTPGPQE